MLSNPSTPRPRPPAKVKRTHSLNLGDIIPPPPPYAPRLDMLLDSPISVTRQLVDTSTPDDPSVIPTIERWMNERSKQELSELLLKADNVIKSREDELGYTSALCRSLYQDNASLKSQHDMFLASIPSKNDQNPSPYSSRPSSALGQSPHYYSASISRSPNDTPLTLSPPRPRHHRKISVTPDELSQLADQNAELLDKLEKLEEEAELADQAGKRKLRKLEKEIQGLKEELDKTQARSEELVERAQSILSLSNEEVMQRRKEEREERVREFRLKQKTSSEGLDNEVRDFAPAPELPLSGLSKTRPLNSSPTPSPSPPIPNLSTKPAPIPFVEDEDRGEGSSYFPPAASSTSSSSSSTPQLEFALISQLLQKVQELEEANAQIVDEQHITADKLHIAQREAESIRKAYAYLGEEAKRIHMLTNSTSDKVSPSVSNEGMISFSSLRRTIDGEEDDEFSRGILEGMHSTNRGGISASKPVTSRKTRKSIVGLFDADEGQDRGSGSGLQADYPSKLEVSPGFRTVSPPDTDPADLSNWSNAATEGMGPSSPTLSTLNLSSMRPKIHTLGSELGSEFGEDWGENAGNHHLRTSSLYDLTGMVPSREGSPALSPGGSPLVQPSFVFAQDEGASDMDWDDVEDEPARATVGSITPNANRGLQLNLDPSTPRASGSAHAMLRTTSAPRHESHSSRSYRLSQTMQARTNRWVEGRYGDTTPSNSLLRRRRPHNRPIRANRDSDTSIIFTQTFDNVVRQLSFSGTIHFDETRDEAEGESELAARRINPPTSARDENAVILPPPRQDGFVGFILEVWLWLQFAIVVLVFLWAMARRGPKSVLQEAERRRSMQISATSR